MPVAFTVKNKQWAQLPKRVHSVSAPREGPLNHINFCNKLLFPHTFHLLVNVQPTLSVKIMQDRWSVVRYISSLALWRATRQTLVGDNYAGTEQASGSVLLRTAWMKPAWCCERRNYFFSDFQIFSHISLLPYHFCPSLTLNRLMHKPNWLDRTAKQLAWIPNHTQT